MNIRILIADDHPVIIRGVKDILASAFELEVADEAGTTQETLDKVRRNDYDLVLLDISMPGEGGMEALKQIKKDKPELPVLIFSIHPEKQYAPRAIKAGASGYLSKETVPKKLVEAVHRVLKGKKYISDIVQRWLQE